MSVALPKIRIGMLLIATLIEIHMRYFVENFMLMFILTGGKRKVLRTIFNYWTNAGYHPLSTGTVYDSKFYSFTK